MKRVSSYYLIILSSLFLTACGFKPMAAVDTKQASGTALSQELATVRVVVHTQSQQRLLGQQFRTHLEDLINPGEQYGLQKRYDLIVHLTPRVNPGFIAPDGTAQRFLVNLQSNYTLTHNSNGEVIERGRITRNSSYSNLPNSFFSTYVAEQDTLKRLAEQLAEEYRLKLASLISNPPETPSPELEPSEPLIIDPNDATVTFPTSGL